MKTTVRRGEGGRGPLHEETPLDPLKNAGRRRGSRVIASTRVLSLGPFGSMVCVRGPDAEADGSLAFPKRRRAWAPRPDAVTWAAFCFAAAPVEPVNGLSSCARAVYRTRHALVDDSPRENKADNGTRRIRFLERLGQAEWSRAAAVRRHSPIAWQ